MNQRAVLTVLAGVAWLGVGCAAVPSRAAGPATAGPSAAAPGVVRMPSVAPPPAISLSPSGPAADDDYRLAPLDQVTITVYGQKDLTRTVRLSEAGAITLPLLGEMGAAGLSPGELERAIEHGLRGRYLVNPRVNVTVAEFQGRRFGVMGAVHEPGAFALRANHTTVLHALSEAKGVKETANRVAYVVRARPRPGEPQPVTVDLDALLRTGDPAHNVVVEPGDSVYVPEANTYYVAGEVEKQGAFSLRRDTTLSKALTEAGGVTKRAATGEVRVVRTLATGQKQELGAFDLRAVMEGDRSQDILLEPQDIVVVPASGAKRIGYAFLDVLKSVLRFSLIAF